jgi:cysteinyl-tRNA synthetase
MKIYNTLSGHKEDFIPRGDTVKMYVCGVTPYAPSHLGHAMSYIVFDTIRRYLEFRGYKVKYVQNFTDIDDKIIARANESRISTKELGQRFIDQYFADMDALNIKRADIYPRATEEIPKMLEVITGLIQKGHAYEVGGDVYFRVKSRPDYGKLSRRTLDGMMAGARIEIGESKEHPLDFALWKAAKPGEPQWQSPWGQGRPGWHIECTAMSLKYLGETLDIHGGGQDLIFPHHENEIAQSESFTGVKPFVRYWLHNGLMQLDEEKMSKSTGKLIGINEVLKKDSGEESGRYSADAIRLWVLSSHYRSPITFSDENLGAMEKGMERLRSAAHVDIKESAAFAIDAQPYRERFVEAMNDDFNSPQAVAALFDLARELNRGRDEGLNISEARKTLLELAAVLGLTLRSEQAALDISLQSLLIVADRYGVKLGETKDVRRIIDSVSDKRIELRRAKKYQLADSIRSDLKELGVTLEDTPRRTVWRYKKP